jgi:hypothetical protein
MWNRASAAPSNGEAILEYRNADYHVVRSGTFVRCAVTGQTIAMDDLRYWSVSRQEAYVDAAAAIKRRLQTGER